MDLIPTKAEIGQILRPQMWDATVTDMRLYPSVTIFCISAPSAPRQIMGGRLWMPRAPAAPLLTLVAEALPA
jgi:hypothetical protein